MKCRLFKWFSQQGRGVIWTNTSKWIAAIKQYNAAYARVVQRWTDKRDKDFGVTIQPMMVHSKLPASAFDTTDCFHPTLATHQKMAVGLWNNMLAKSNKEKVSQWSDTDQPACPDSSARIINGAWP